MRLIPYLMTFLLLPVTLGCPGAAGLPDVGQVSGVVTVDGSPGENLTIEFESDKGQAAYGTTDASGYYELTSAGGKSGAQLGPNTVRISTTLDAPPPPNYSDPIAAKFNIDSELTVVVEAGKNTHNFDL